IAFDAARGQVVLFGGSPSHGNPATSDTWVWDGSVWTQKSPATSPPVGGYPAIVYDSARSEVVLLLGGFTDTWCGTDPLGRRGFRRQALLRSRGVRSWPTTRLGARSSSSEA